MPENWSLVGNAWAVELLHEHVAQDSPRHAYLFSGAPGVGRRTLAMRFAQALNCTRPPRPGMPCGECTDCKQIGARRHPDVTVIQPEAEGGSLKVGQVREVCRSLALKPYQAMYRVAIFANFQLASDGASNALLKTLEEPPSYAVLILTADSPEALLPTIVSRCEILRLAPAALEAVERRLRERGASEERARLLAHVSGGRPGLAISLLDDAPALAFRDERLGDLLSLLPASRAEKFSYAEALAKDKIVMRRVLTLWSSFWRDVLGRAGGASVPLDNVDREAAIESVARRVGLQGAHQAVRQLDGCLERLDANVNARLLAEVLLLDLPS